MAVYEPLGKLLRKTSASRVPMTFREVEAVIGRKLPASAYRHRPWWANEARGHSHAKAWLDAGYQTEQVDMTGKKLVFVRKGTQRGMAEGKREFAAEEKKTGIHPLIGALKGTFTIEPGWDLTKPALDPEELEAWEANLDKKADMVGRVPSDKLK